MKQITETFVVKFDSLTIAVEARNFNTHQLSINWASQSARVPLTTSEMKKLANHLMMAADKIEQDPAFKNNPGQSPTPTTDKQ